VSQSVIRQAESVDGTTNVEPLINRGKTAPRSHTADNARPRASRPHQARRRVEPAKFHRHTERGRAPSRMTKPVSIATAQGPSDCGAKSGHQQKTASIDEKGFAKVPGLRAVPICSRGTNRVRRSTGEGWVVAPLTGAAGRSAHWGRSQAAPVRAGLDQAPKLRPPSCESPRATASQSASSEP
jgi:hypothetical protein